ncbi:autotransporter outer membrane beta-barrel domain-containing protein [Helicobacter sp. MIT 05-5294]|uniref:autotransporter outer membrane beta-barrel domain-containing protein n=1 Tax=Helicobacter sp. MIT 05-5294 TaxID=1548150 RepID=UPI00051FEAFA|nr:autotransporter outer membrane beta-barrel domain-containing protein [Helicobacter sp. MIT 05-5294]TLD87282.1 autotransporter outer membrane beta-barrel domain-containing protein [Helicobacter sp. MIT 05-5294]
MRKTRLSYFATKALLGSSMALLGTQLNAAEITIANQADFEQYFELDDTNTWVYQGAKEDTTINLNTDNMPRFGNPNQDIYINIGESNTLTIKDSSMSNPCGNNYNSCDTDAIIYNLDVGREFDFNANNQVTGNTILQNIHLEAARETGINSNLEIKNSEVYFVGGSYEGQSYSGILGVAGNLKISNSELNFYGRGIIKAAGNATISNTGFYLVKDSFTALEANNLTLIEAKSFNSDITTNKISGVKTISFRDYVSDSALLNEIYKDAKVVLPEDLLDLNDINNVALVAYTLEVKDGKLVANGGATEEAYKTENQVAFDKAAIDRLQEYIDNEDYKGDYVWSDDLVARLQEYLDNAKAALDSIDASDDKAYINAVTGGLNNEDMTAALALRGIADSLGAFGADLMSREGIQLAIDIKNDTQENGKSASNFTQATNTTISVANDMSIGSRIAMQNNPYSTYATNLSKLKFASVASDIAPNYLDNTYARSVWANVFGGANIIDSHSGGLYGVSVGADNYITDNVLLGVYFSYANSTLKDSSFKQESDNYQLGIYSNIHLNPLWELNLKGYGQISPMDTNYAQTDGDYKGDYTSKFLGLSASIGRRVEFEDRSFYLKPFVGANYYFSYIPSHTDKGLISKKMDSSKNNSLSLEVGAEFRKYFNESSYFFAIPKIEQYVLNSSDDYNVTLAANNAFFTQVRTDDKKKTYGGLIVGGNMNLTDQLSLNVGVGAKQILAGKVDSKNETYLTGQAGLKYKF